MTAEAGGRDYYEGVIKIADEWLESHKVTESWRVINMLRDALARSRNGR